MAIEGKYPWSSNHTSGKKTLSINVLCIYLNNWWTVTHIFFGELGHRWLMLIRPKCGKAILSRCQLCRPGIESHANVGHILLWQQIYIADLHALFLFKQRQSVRWQQDITQTFAIFHMALSGFVPPTSLTTKAIMMLLAHRRPTILPTASLAFDTQTI